MSRKHFEYAVKLDESNAQDIVAFGKQYGWELADEVDWLLDPRYQLSDGIYMDMIWDFTKGRPVSFTSFPGYIFDACWCYGDGTRGPFQRIRHS